MSHQIPSQYRYVSSITIVNPGSGYIDGSSPTITISGGSGTGAAATCTIVNGAIQSVTVTNVGTGYVTAPTVTVSGSGGAVLTANLSFATSVSTEYTENLKLDAKYSIPEFIRTEYTTFATFIEKYFDYMDQEGKPNHILYNQHFYDIDEADDELLDKWALQLVRDFPYVVETEKKNLYKHAKDIYESKGSQRAIKAFFRIVYDIEIDVEYTSKYVLRASDGRWVEKKAIKALNGYNNYEVLNLDGTLCDLRYFETTGSVTIEKFIPITVNRASKLANTVPQVYDLSISLPESVTEIYGPGAGAAGTATVVAGEITEITLTSNGEQYHAAPEVILYDATGEGAVARANINSSFQVESITILDGGSGYSATPTVAFETHNTRTYLVLRNELGGEENAKAYLTRTLSTISEGTYSGSEDDAGFRVGQIYSISESGDDGRGYALDYFAEDYVYIGGSNSAYIRVKTVNSSGVPLTWDIVNAGRNFLNTTTNILMSSPTGEDVTVTITTGYLYLPQGRWLDDRGKLSDVNRLQDNRKYQSYSYVIKSGISQNTWDKKYKDLMHPAGMQVFGELVVTNELDYRLGIDVETSGLVIRYFENDELITTVDAFTFHITKPFEDEVIVSDDISLHPKLVFEDNTIESGPNALVGVSDVGEQTYFAEDYLENGGKDYVSEGGFFIQLHKFISNEDVAQTSEDFVTNITWYREFSDVATVSDIVDVQLIVNLTLLSDNISNITDALAIEVGKVFTETTTNADTTTLNIGLNKEDNILTSQDFVINTSKIVSDSSETSETIQMNFTTPVSNTATVSDTGTITGPQDYSDLTYFAEDYIETISLGSF